MTNEGRQESNAHPNTHKHIQTLLNELSFHEPNIPLTLGLIIRNWNPQTMQFNITGMQHFYQIKMLAT